MKLDAKRRGQYVMKGEQRGMFKISSRTKIKPKDDVICCTEESISVTEWSQSLNQPGSAPAPSLSSIICYFPCSQQSISLQVCVLVCVWARLSKRVTESVDGSVIVEGGLALSKRSSSVCTACEDRSKDNQYETMSRERERRVHEWFSRVRTKTGQM